MAPALTSKKGQKRPSEYEPPESSSSLKWGSTYAVRLILRYKLVLETTMLGTKFKLTFIPVTAYQLTYV